MSILDHDAVLSGMLSRMFAAGKIPHAMMLVSGHAMEAARAVAGAIVCENKTFPSCGACRHCRKSSRDIHPDIITVAGKASIQVDQIREMRLDAHVLPNDGDRKVYLIQEAQTMTESAQNAFLKILEQPPTGVYFILAVSDRRGIIDTIRSRVVEYTIKEEQKKVTIGEVSQALLSACLSKDELAICKGIDQGFTSDRGKAIAFLAEFAELLNQRALRADAQCEQMLALYQATQEVAVRLENAGNVSLCAAYFSIRCLEAVS